VTRAARDPDTVAGYVELHIEQSYRLEKAGIEIGVVTGIVGRVTYHVTFYGKAAHSGTTGIPDRRDALHGAAHFILRAQELIHEQFGDGVFTCGNAEVRPGSFNVIPEQTRLTVELRHPDEAGVEEMEDAMIKLAQQCASDHRLRVTARRLIHRTAAAMSPRAMEAVERACRTVGVSSMRIVSYAGHDAQMMSTFTSGMIFIPSVGGISHNPREFSRWDHVVNGANVLLHTVLNLAQKS
jgi:N-carbamoyl-L-amino-acid hydrolase